MAQAAAGGKEVKTWRAEDRGERGREERRLGREGFGGRVGGVLGAPDGQAEEGGQEPPGGKAWGGGRALGPARAGGGPRGRRKRPQEGAQRHSRWGTG